MEQNNEQKNEDIEDWRNEHGKPSFKYLQSLEDDGGPIAIEKLRSIASDLNVDYEPNTPIKELIRRIKSATRSGSVTTT